MRKRLLYTFGNHMHWIELQWLRGHGVLPDSVREMLALTRAGVRGNVGFDGAGYERLASEDPQAFADLRAAVRAGELEVLGASYGQPNGLLHGGESNIRQRVFGARTVLRLFGVRPRAVWEGGFDFFPQLPQILSQCGYQGSALHFGWTWCSPQMPEEQVGRILWEGLDGTRIPAVPNHPLCVQGWPEDMEERLAAAAAAGGEQAALVQWLDLLDQPDWQQGAARLLPELARLREDPRFELTPVTLSQMLAELEGGEAPVRRYTLDDVFHGASAGKNGDYLPRFSRMCEEQLLAAESISALAGLLGRPYASYDVYPTHELEEAWRELMVAQHRDVHAGEGLSGSVAERSFERSLSLSAEVFARTLTSLAGRVDALEGTTVVYNPLGWTRDVAYERGAVRDVPAYGYKVVDPYEVEETRPGPVEVISDEHGLGLVRGDFEVHIDRRLGLVTQVVSRDFPRGLLQRRRPLGGISMLRKGERESFETVSYGRDGDGGEEFAEHSFLREGMGGSRVRVIYSLPPLVDALWIRFQAESLTPPDAGFAAALSTHIQPAFDGLQLRHDHPYGVSEVHAERDRVRRFPGETDGTHLLENVVRPFTGHSFVDLLDAGGSGRGLLAVHDGSQAWSREDDGVRALLSLYDPWDADYFDNVFEAEMWLLPHGPMSDTARMRLSMELNLGSPRFDDHAPVRGGGDLPPSFGALAVDCPNVLATAFHRESGREAQLLARHFARDVRDPYVIRLVELDGKPADVLLRLPGTIAKAARTDLLGEVLETLRPTAARAPFEPLALPWTALRFAMKPHEIATVMVDLELGRQSALEGVAQRFGGARMHRRK